MANEPVIGIDLGTSYSRVAVYQKGKVEIIADDQGETSPPSYVEFTEDNIIIGQIAKHEVARNPSNTRVIFDVKRLIGRNIDDSTIQQDLKYWPFHVVNDCGEPKIKIDVGGEEMTFKAEEILSLVLKELKKAAEAFLGTSVFKAVITVPAYFNQAQRQAIQIAGPLAGLNVLRMMNEPTAVALAYALDEQSEVDKNVLFFDMGGGNFNVAIVCIGDGSCEVKAFAGDTHLGGEDFEIKMVNHFIEEFERKHKKDMSVDKAAVSRLRTECEWAKYTLSQTTQADIRIYSLFEAIDFYSTISRTQFEELCLDLFQSTLVQVEKALKDARMDKSKISEVVLVGGSTRIPKIEKLLQDYFDGKKLNRLYRDDAVVCGAAIQAAILKGEKIKALDKVLLLDATPLSLGIETAGGSMTTMIKRNVSIPAKHTETFTTYVDNQSVVCVKVVEGESPVAKENILLGKFELRGIPSALRGLLQIQVTFDIDANGILEVSAVDKSTGKGKRIAIMNAKGRLSRADFVKMVNGAEKYEEDEKKQVVLFEFGLTACNRNKRKI